MSRTYRRKQTKIGYQNFESEERFNRVKWLYENNNPKPGASVPRSGYCPHQNDWYDYYCAQRFPRYSHGHHTYKGWKKANTAIFHSDGGFGNYGFQSIPAFFRRIKSQRPFRVEVRSVMKQGLAHDSWDEIIFPVLPDLSWLYF